MWTLFSPSIFTWVPGIELSSPGLHGKFFYLQSYIGSPFAHVYIAITFSRSLFFFVVVVYSGSFFVFEMSFSSLKLAM